MRTTSASHSCSSASNAATTFEMSSIQGLEILTYMLWTSFPCIHLLHFMGELILFLVSDAMRAHDMLRTVLQVTAKECASR
eukprot:760485-Hanusia_phi.AAC.3